MLREIIHNEVVAVVGPGKHTALEKRTERALRLYLFKLNTMLLSKATPTTFVRRSLRRFLIRQKTA